MTEAEPGRDNAFLTQAYGEIDPQSLAMLAFLGEIHATLVDRAGFDRESSLIDIGCGRGYFLDYLDRKGYPHLAGLEPSTGLTAMRLHHSVQAGSFEENPFGDNSFDIAFTCHTLHHLPDREPTAAVREMFRLARRYVVVVEINNTNLPMLLRSVARIKDEINAPWYNRPKVVRLIKKAGGQVKFETDLRAGYLSGDSAVHRLAARLGRRPYNLVIAEARP